MSPVISDQVSEKHVKLPSQKKQKQKTENSWEESSKNPGYSHRPSNGIVQVVRM